MPKIQSKSSKKKKFNSRFPPARIKKIMQTDEDVGKVAAAVPVIISRALELFIESLITETSQTTLAKNAKTLSTSHIKHTIHTNKQFDFLKDLVANIPDHNTEESNGDNGFNNGDAAQKRGRGRPKKIKDSNTEGWKAGESSKGSPESSEVEDDDEDEATDVEAEDSSEPKVTKKHSTQIPDPNGSSTENSVDKDDVSPSHSVPHLDNLRSLHHASQLDFKHPREQLLHQQQHKYETESRMSQSTMPKSDVLYPQGSPYPSYLVHGMGGAQVQPINLSMSSTPTPQQDEDYDT